MAKAYSELLGEWVKQRASSQRDRNLVAFLGVRDDVREALSAGYSVATIWAHMHEERRVLFGYDTFLSHVNRHIRLEPRDVAGIDPATVTPPPIGRPARQKKAATQGAAGPQAKAPDAVPGFTFNAAPKVEDLI